MKYIALIHKEVDSDYGVHFPDFPGCVTVGSNLDEAKDLAYEALMGHIELMKELGHRIPSPSNLEYIMQEAENNRAVAFMLDIPIEKTIRVNVTFSQKILELIDNKAKNLNLTRSAFLAESALNFNLKNPQNNLKSK